MKISHFDDIIHFMPRSARLQKIYSKRRQKTRAEAKRLIFYWTVREFLISGNLLAKRFKMGQLGGVHTVNKGEKIAKDRDFKLVK